jgi:hypothetical protein
MLAVSKTLMTDKRQEPAVEFGKIFRSQTTSSATRFGQYRDGMDFIRKATVLLKGASDRSDLVV